MRISKMTQCGAFARLLHSRADFQQGATASGRRRREVVIAPGYFQHESAVDTPPVEVQWMIEFRRAQGLPLLMVCDTYAQHMV